MLNTKSQSPLLQACAVVLLLLSAASTTSAQSSRSVPAANEPETFVVTNRAQLTLAGAERAIKACREQAESIGVQVNIAVVDDGGHLLAFARMDGARPGSVYTSITKATTAATKRGATGPLPSADNPDTHLSLAVENAAIASGGKFTTLKGGAPILYGDQVIGAVGVGGATGEQDAEIARAGVEALSNVSGNVTDNAHDAGSQKLYATWLVEDISGRGVIDNAQTKITIGKDGRVSGSTGVNRYVATAKISGASITIEPGPATTRAAGPPALMDQESRFLAALGRVAKYRIDENGLLFLLDRDGNVLLRASSMHESANEQ